MGSASVKPLQSQAENKNTYDWSNVSLRGSSEEIRKFLISNYDEINWSELSQNRYGIAMIFLEENYEHIDWTNLSKNSSYGALRILCRNQHKIVWNELMMNKSSGVEKLLRENPDKIVSDILYLNKSKWAINLFIELCTNKNKI